MNRHLLGILASVTFGLLDALMVGFSDHADKSTAMLFQHALTLGWARHTLCSLVGDVHEPQDALVFS
jgi:hypothetical protein